MAGKLVQFRVDPALSARLDEEARTLGVSRSDVARYLLERTLTNDAERAAARAVLWSVLARLQQNIGSFTQEVSGLLHKYVGATVQPANSSPEEPRAVPAAEEASRGEEQWGEGATDGLSGRNSRSRRGQHR